MQFDRNYFPLRFPHPCKSSCAHCPTLTQRYLFTTIFEIGFPRDVGWSHSCFMKFNLVRNAIDVHITKSMMQVWSKANFDAESEARYQNFLIFLRQRTLHGFNCFTHVHTMLASESESAWSCIASQMWNRLKKPQLNRDKYLYSLITSMRLFFSVCNSF